MCIVHMINVCHSDLRETKKYYTYTLFIFSLIFLFYIVFQHFTVLLTLPSTLFFNFSNFIFLALLLGS